jgi:GNAT superfamily N-acetyltransferase
LTIAVRAATPDEYARVGSLTVDAYRALPVDHLWGGYEADILDTAGRAESATILVAVDDDEPGTIMGAVTYVSDTQSPWNEWTEPGETQFRLLAVDLDARRHGTGAALVRACTDRADRDGLRILIHTTAWMEAAQRMYDRLGFVRRPDRDVPYEVWNAVPNTDLPGEWIGEPFLAYAWNTST